MSVETLLVGPSGHGGEGVYVDGLRANPPDDVRYDVSPDFHRPASGASCRYVTEIALNRIVHRLTIPDMGFRAVRLKRHYDLVHVHAHPVAVGNLGSTPLVMSEGSSSAVYLLDYLGWTPSKLRQRYHLTRRIYKRLGVHDRLLAMDRAFRVYVFSDWARYINIEWGADPDKIEVIPPGFETPPAPARRRRDVFRFLFVGSDFERKGGFEVVEAFAHVARSHPDVSLVLAGTDPAQRNPDRLVHSWVSAGRREKGLAQLRELEAQGRVERRDWVTQAELRADVYPNAHAFVMPTHAEGFGFTNVEAMSFGLPVITSHAGPATEIVTPGVNGILVEPGDVDDLTAAMMSVLDHDRAEAIGLAARTTFLGRFTRERLQKDLTNLYQRALTG